MKKRKFFICLFSFVLLASFISVSVYASEYSKRFKAPENLLSVVESEKDKIFNNLVKWANEKNVSLDKSALSISNRQYLINDLRNIDPEKNYTNISQMFSESNIWLFVVNYKGRPYITIEAGLFDGRYQVLKYGDNAEFIERAVKNMPDSLFNKLNLTMYQGRIYFYNEDNQFIEVPLNQEELNKNPNIYFKALNGKDVIKEIKADFLKAKKQKSDEVKFGNPPGLTERISK